jgi:hypothetical protein
LSNNEPSGIKNATHNTLRRSKSSFTSKMYCGLHFQLDVTSYLPDLPPLILLISKIADLPGTRFPNDEVVMAELIECLTSQFFF